MSPISSAWPAGSVTGIGSMPGTDADEASRLVLGELTDLPYLPELPARGPGAEMIGRGAALLVALPVEIAPSGWRLAAHPGRDLRRARDLLERDLDALEASADGYTGALKIQAAGPWTLAAGVELPNGQPVLADAGAVRDLTESLVEGVRAHALDVARRVPGASVVLQLDEPSLPAVLAARVPTASGYGTLSAVDPVLAAERLRAVLDVAASGGRVVHCCAADVPIAVLRAAGADAIALDAKLIEKSGYDELGEVIEAGVSLWLGVVPTKDAAISVDTARAPITRLWGELGFPSSELASSIVATPACGLASASPAYAAQVLAVLRDVGSWLRDESA